MEFVRHSETSKYDESLNFIDIILAIKNEPRYKPRVCVSVFPKINLITLDTKISIPECKIKSFFRLHFL